MLILNFLCNMFFFYHANQVQVFKLYEFSLFLIKMVTRYKAHVKFKNTEHQPQEGIRPLSFSSL